jgi:hypothetical protein
MSMGRIRVYALGVILGLALTACADEMEPAQRAISDIDTRVNAAAPEAAKYVPEQLRQVQAALEDLRATFEKKQYVTVIAKAPVVKRAAEGLGAAAAARKAEITKALSDEWTALADAVSADTAAIQDRLDLQTQRAGKHAGATPDLDAARAALSSDASLWSKAQAAFATGNMVEAVSIARTVKAHLDQLAGSIREPRSPR